MIVTELPMKYERRLTYSFDKLIKFNRAGDDQKELTMQQIIKKY